MLKPTEVTWMWSRSGHLRLQKQTSLEVSESQSHSVCVCAQVFLNVCNLRARHCPSSIWHKAGSNTAKDICKFSINLFYYVRDQGSSLSEPSGILWAFSTILFVTKVFLHWTSVKAGTPFLRTYSLLLTRVKGTLLHKNQVPLLTTWHPQECPLLIF